MLPAGPQTSNNSTGLSCGTGEGSVGRVFLRVARLLVARAFGEAGSGGRETGSELCGTMPRSGGVGAAIVST